MFDHHFLWRCSPVLLLTRQLLQRRFSGRKEKWWTPLQNMVVKHSYMELKLIWFGVPYTYGQNYDIAKIRPGLVAFLAHPIPWKLNLFWIWLLFFSRPTPIGGPWALHWLTKGRAQLWGSQYFHPALDVEPDWHRETPQASPGDHHYTGQSSS